MFKNASMFLFCGFLATGPILMAEEAIKTSIILGDEYCDEDDSDDDNCCKRRRFSLFSDEDIDDDCWYDDTAGWPGLREDTWFRDLEH